MSDEPHILVVDDDDRIRDLLRRYMVQDGFRVTAASDAKAARKMMTMIDFDLAILDIMMPDEDGLSLLSSLRENGNDTPVMLLTARGLAEDRIEGLKRGADDYLPKPFEPRELLLRIQTILRRTQSRPQAARSVEFGELEFDVERGALARNGQPVRLTTREIELMKLFCRAVGRALPREELTGGDDTISDRAVDVQINRLRRKIEPDPREPRYLRTIRGAGYMFVPD